MSSTFATQRSHHRPETGHSDGCCIMAPPFDHLAYRFGQLLTPGHLQRAQQSVYEKLKLHNRCLHGWGVVCGLEVTAVPPEPDCAPNGGEKRDDDVAEPARDLPWQPTASHAAAAPAHSVAHRTRPQNPCDLPKTLITVECGIAIDCPGHELVVREGLTVDLYSALSPEDRRVVDDDQGHTLWVSLCFKMTGVEWVRAAMPSACDVGTEAFHAFQREGVCVKVSLEPPTDRDPCEICCTCCDAECVLLARIEGYCRGHRVGRVDNSVRRLLARYTPTVIAGIGWHHGATYHPHDADVLLWDIGLKVAFSRPVYADTLTEGVCDVYVHSRHNEDLWVLDGNIELGQVTNGLVSWFKYRGDPHDQENIDPRDRILFVLRCDNVLDHCCLPVDGNHVGGLVPALSDEPKPVKDRLPVGCARSRLRGVPWASGDRTPGSTFESWFIASDEPGRKAGRKGAY